MTDIQVRYWDYKENQRHNQAVEGETYRHNSATEVQAANELIEVNRHNVVSEQETNRHNVVTETETHRHNSATEQQEKNELKETKRHNKVQESIGKRQASASEIQARAATSQASTARKRANTEAAVAKSQIELNTANANLATLKGRTEENIALKAAYEAGKAAIDKDTAVYEQEITKIAAYIKRENVEWNKWQDRISWLFGGGNSAANIIKSVAALLTKL